MRLWSPSSYDRMFGKFDLDELIKLKNALLEDIDNMDVIFCRYFYPHIERHFPGVTREEFVKINIDSVQAAVDNIVLRIVQMGG